MTIRHPAPKRFLSNLAAAAALAGASALAMTAVAVPAHAQKKKKEEAPKADYSKELIAAYKTYEPLTKAATPDVAAQQAGLPALQAAASTPDDKLLVGQATLNTGVAAKDYDLQLQGARMMIDSGKLPPESVGQVNYVAGQLSYNKKDYAAAQTYFRTAMDAGFSQEDGPLLLAESYFQQKDYAGGYKYVEDTLAANRAAGKPVNEDLIKRAMSTAYNNDQAAEANKWALVYAREFPTQTSWGDAIAISINTSEYDKPAMLDLLRLAGRTDTLRNRNMYLEYIDAADPRKLPQEVIKVLDAGTASNVLDSSQSVTEARSQASTRLAADKSELPSLVRDAKAPSAKLVTVMAAADTLLSYGRGAEAEELYGKALAQPGADKALVLTRMGIAQVDQGKFADAEASFQQVEGARKPIANLWALYATQQSAGT